MFFVYSILILLSPPSFSQETEDDIGAFRWYNCQRSYPFDTIPQGAFQNAIDQRRSLLQSTGYQSSGIIHWQEIGPKPMQYNGLDQTGRIHQVLYDPRDPSDPNHLGNCIYLMGEAGGLWKTTDGGLNWYDHSGDLPSLSGGAFAIYYDANNNKTLYFGTGDRGFISGFDASLGIFKSTNDGATWTPINNGLQPGTAVNKMAISPNDQSGNTIFAATYYGLYKTIDGGASWNKIIPGPNDPIQNLICNDVCFSPNGSTVYAVGPTLGHTPPWDIFGNGIGYWRSDDYGNSFNPISPFGFPHNSTVIDKTLCAVSKASEGLVWFITIDESDNLADVYKSTNHGQNFTAFVGVGGDLSVTRNQLAIRASDVDQNICFAGGQWLYRTENGVWSDITCVGGYCGAHGDVLSLDFNPFDPNKIIEGNDGGIFLSSNLGGSWVSCNQNLGSQTLLWSCASSTYDANFVAGGLHDFSLAYNSNAEPGSTNWNSVWVGGDGGNMKASPFLSRHFVAGLDFGTQGIQYSMNGTSFNDASGYHEGASSVTENAPFAHHPTIPGVVYTARFDHWTDPDPQHPQHVDFRKSTDYGQTWGGDLTPLRQIIRPTDWNSTAPYLIALSQFDPNTIIMSFTNGSEFWLNHYSTTMSRLIKSTDGGLSWEGIDYGSPIVTGGDGHGIPNRAFSDIEFDPKNNNELYLTVSGYYYPNTNQGHVFKSIDGGYNWASIDFNLPDLPVNDIVVHYTGTGVDEKELIVATDAGIYSSRAPNYGNWSEIATGFPNTMAIHLDYNRLSGKLFANTWGRGAWVHQLDQGPIYVQDVLYITDNVTLNKQIVVAPGGKLVLGHSSLPAFTIHFDQPSDVPAIIVQNGGQIVANGGNQITMTSPNQWGGIEFQNGGYGTLTHCTFQNTSNAVVVDYSIGAIDQIASLGPTSSIDINNCIFNNCSVEVNADNTKRVYIENNQFNGCNTYSYGAIGINYSSNILVNQNSISNCSGTGIAVSNSNIQASFNNITDCGFGITLDNCNASSLTSNTISGTGLGLYLSTSSPTMLSNTITNTSQNGGIAIYTNYASFPRLRPATTDEATIWDAGVNHITADPTNGTAIYFMEGSADLDGGINFINAGNGYLAEYIYPAPANNLLYATNNCWDNGNPDPTKFSLHDKNANPVAVYWDPSNCTPPFTSILKENDFSKPEVPEYMAGGQIGPNEDPMSDPPQPFIIDLGEGRYDTIHVTIGRTNLNLAEAMYSQGIKQEYENNFTGALNTYKSVVQNYRDSVAAIKAVIRMLPCTDRITNDTSKYTSLGTYYSGLLVTCASNSLLGKVTNELTHKVQVRKGEYPGAISSYENDIQNSTDTLEILCYQLNIVETYMLFSPAIDGDQNSFTGRYSQLKPVTKRDGFKMIHDLLHHIQLHSNNNSIPTVFSLSQNYPNPFNPVTKINYTLPVGAKVSIKVYDILGRIVKEVVNEFKEAGAYTIAFDGSSLASGVYFYKIEAGKFVQSKKMVLLK